MVGWVKFFLFYLKKTLDSNLVFWYHSFVGEIDINKEDIMVLSEMAQKVVENRQFVMFKYNKKNTSYDVKFDEGNKRGWTILDSWSASVYLTVWKKCNEGNQRKLDNMPIERALTVAFKLIN